MSSFSERHGYSGQPKEITIREDAPESIRFVALGMAYDIGSPAFGPSWVQDVVCRVLRRRPDYSASRSPEPARREVEYMVYGCEWFKVCDLIEVFDKALGGGPFSKAINDCFVEEGIG